MSKFAIVTTTRGKLEDTKLYSSWQALYGDQLSETHLQTFNNNTRGLSVVYNEALQKFKDQYDYITFIHDDVSLQDGMFQRKLEIAHQKYDIVGIAGGDDNKFAPQLWLWNEMSEVKHGFVAHYAPPGNTVFMSSYGQTPSSVKLIDGLFISIKTSALSKLNGQKLFDENFGFHFYDLAMCYRALQNGLSIGVWPIFVIHAGLGDSFRSKEWQDALPKFIEQYSNIRYSVRDKKQNIFAK